MHHTLFIADLHLDEKHPQSTEYFSNFIEKQAPFADAIYVLGDFFELWVGDDDNSSFNQLIKKKLKSITEKKIPIYFLRGNRDFLIGKKFARQTGCSLLPEPSIIELYGKQIMIIHGDALCTNDIKHMKFRQLTGNRFLRFLFACLPLKVRLKIGHKLRKTSKNNHTLTPCDELGITHSAVCDLLTTSKIKHLIHGHIHQPDVFNFFIENTPAERIVLGAWDKHGCALKWYENGKREMLFFKD